jgi:hypothetical protein
LAGSGSRLDTNPDQDPAKLWGSDPIRIW